MDRFHWDKSIGQASRYKGLYCTHGCNWPRAICNRLPRSSQYTIPLYDGDCNQLNKNLKRTINGSSKLILRYLCFHYGAQMYSKAEINVHSFPYFKFFKKFHPTFPKEAISTEFTLRMVNCIYYCIRLQYQDNSIHQQCSSKSVDTMAFLIQQHSIDLSVL